MLAPKVERVRRTCRLRTMASGGASHERQKLTLVAVP